ncbi:MAG: hypothetical protein L6R40_005644 [Gallowayella cf. fulva]|nr:MAG: hypothetical protein L6R40_005644 [Xanthomendoza cf. fulva]
MFELQNAKRSVRAITLQSHNANPRRSVTRSELHSTFSSPDSVDSEDDDAKDRWRRQLDQIYQGGLIEQQPEQVSDAADRPQAIDEANDESYEFPLFSQKPRGSTAKILLKSPSPEIKDPGFVQPARPQDYYFTAAESRHCQGRFGDVAVEGHDVVRESLVKWPGFQLPWRVITATFRSSKRATSASSIVDAALEDKRKRPGKKRRIILRTKLQAMKARGEVARAAAAKKEALAMEKRSRRNREKKLKRRGKARNQKKGEEEASRLYQTYFLSIYHCLLSVDRPAHETSPVPPCQIKDEGHQTPRIHIRNHYLTALNPGCIPTMLFTSRIHPSRVRSLR